MHSTTLAIDYGTKRIGVAVSRGTLADPLAIIANDDQMWERLMAICTTENIHHIIVGLSENTMAEETRKFVEKLQLQTTLPIEFFDETLSSHTVHAKALAGTMKQSKRRQPIDHLAAAEFLQEWLDMVY